MPVILWGVLALLLGAALLAIAARRALPPRAPLVLPPGEVLLPTELQRLARLAIAVGVIPMLAAGAIIARVGASTFFDDDRIRLVVTLLLLASLGILSAFAFRAGSWAKRARGPLDERDREILANAPRIEGAPMLVTVALWVIGLTETFREVGAVPTVWLYLLFWSLLMVKLLALPFGVLAGYRRS